MVGIAEQLEGWMIFQHGEEVVLEVWVQVPGAAKEVPINEGGSEEFKEEVDLEVRAWVQSTAVLLLLPLILLGYRAKVNGYQI